MRLKFKMMLVAALAVFALTAAASASAAPSVTLGSGKTAELAEHTEEIVPIVMSKVGSRRFTLECLDPKIVKGVLTSGVATFPVKALKLEDCTVTEPAFKCELANGGLIETKEVTGEVVDGSKSPDTKIVFKPKSGKELFSIKFQAKGKEECELGHTGAVAVTGRIVTNELNNSSLASSHEMRFGDNELTSELFFGLNLEPMDFDGEFGLSLTSKGTFALAY